MQDLTKGAKDVLAERQRQVEGEGWTPEHDDQHSAGELAEAASSYSHLAAYQCVFLFDCSNFPAPCIWPWEKDVWKPGETPRRSLVKAGALILAEIERLDRAAEVRHG